MPHTNLLYDPEMSPLVTYIMKRFSMNSFLNDLFSCKCMSVCLSECIQWGCSCPHDQKSTSDPLTGVLGTSLLEEEKILLTTLCILVHAYSQKVEATSTPTNLFMYTWNVPSTYSRAFFAIRKEWNYGWLATMWSPGNVPSKRRRSSVSASWDTYNKYLLSVYSISANHPLKKPTSNPKNDTCNICVCANVWVQLPTESRRGHWIS